jgi:hypothetical protein
LQEKNYLNLDNDSRLADFFNLNNKLALSIRTKVFKHNIFNGHNKDIENRRISGRLLKPHYFFTSRYNENNMPSQISH